jgi:hypothetical protein
MKRVINYNPDIINDILINLSEIWTLLLHFIASITLQSQNPSLFRSFFGITPRYRIPKTNSVLDFRKIVIDYKHTIIDAILTLFYVSIEDCYIVLYSLHFNHIILACADPISKELRNT